MKKIVIIGAGPAGIMAAISSKTHYPNADVIIIERNNQLGTKLRLTGAGRCNVTADLPNASIIELTPKNGNFLYSSLSNFNSKDIQNFFVKENCALKTEDHNRVFPASDKAESIIKALESKILSLNINIIFNTLVKDIDVNMKILKTNQNNIPYDYLIIATGGKTYPHTGSDGIGYELAKTFGHTITELLPAEVPLVSNDKVIQDKILQGLSFKDVGISILENGKIKKTIIHDLIITHFGISGPAALMASYYVQNVLKKETPALIKLDFIPSCSINELENYSLIELNNLLSEKEIPKRLLTYLNKTTASNENFIYKLKQYPLSISNTRGFKQAFVTNGGVSIKELDPKTMKSKINNSISFCGEIIDVSGFTGGLNITSAFSTGYTAGKYLLR